MVDYLGELYWRFRAETFFPLLIKYGEE